MLFSPEYPTKVIFVNASGRGPQITAEEAAELERARERMLARHKLIEGMIRNNELQLKNESARGGAEIELECARRDVAKGDAGTAAQAELERATARLQALQEFCEQQDVIGVHLGVRRHLRLAVVVVGDGVVRLGDPDVRVGALAELAAHHEGEHARIVRLVREGEQVEHQ